MPTEAFQCVRAGRPSRYGGIDPVSEEAETVRLSNLEVYAERAAQGLPIFDDPTPAAPGRSRPTAHAPARYPKPTFPSPEPAANIAGTGADSVPDSVPHPPLSVPVSVPEYSPPLAVIVIHWHNGWLNRPTADRPKSLPL